MTSLTVWVLAEIVVILSQAERASIPLDIIDSLRPWQQALREDRVHERIALLGDSVLASVVGDPSLPSATEAALRSRGDRHARAAIHTLWFPAWSPVTEYFLADEILRARPDRIVLELNLRALGPGALEVFTYPELSGWIEARHLPEAALLPLSQGELTLNRMLFYQLLVGCHLEGLWAHVVDRQARIYEMRTPVELRVDQALDRTEAFERHLSVAVPLLTEGLLPGKNRSNAASLRKVLGTALSGIDGTEPRVRVLLALIDRFERAGKPTLVWVAPVNVEHIRSVGISTDGLDRTTNVLRRLVMAHGAAFFDFHSVVSDDGFLDHGDHLRSKGTPAMTEVIGTLLAAAIARTAPPPPMSEVGTGFPVSRRAGDAVQ